MRFVNHTKAAAAWTMGFDRAGHELVVVAVKATYDFPEDGLRPQFSSEQIPITTSDRFSGEPGLSAPLYEADLAHRKPFCDVLLNGSAHAPDGIPAAKVPVGLKVGAMIKAFNVVGDRVWEVGTLSVSTSPPLHFTALPISYDNAFGGVDLGASETSKLKSYPANPVGRGYCPSRREIDGQKLPNTEELQRTVDDTKGPYQPLAFGSVGRNWQPRASFAGTYDQAWMDHRAPFWPDDFDDRYFQAAPSDQQIPHPLGNEEVVLKNLTPLGGLVRFNLPIFKPQVLFVPHRGAPMQHAVRTDTVLFEPDLKRFTLCARVALPMRKSCFDLREVVVGSSVAQWLGRRRFGSKPYYESLAHLIRAGRRR
jgi:hypothetical protein